MDGFGDVKFGKSDGFLGEGGGDKGWIMRRMVKGGKRIEFSENRRKPGE